MQVKMNFCRMLLGRHAGVFFARWLRHAELPTGVGASCVLQLACPPPRSHSPPSKKKRASSLRHKVRRKQTLHQRKNRQLNLNQGPLPRRPQRRGGCATPARENPPNATPHLLSSMCRGVPREPLLDTKTRSRRNPYTCWHPSPPQSEPTMWRLGMCQAPLIHNIVGLLGLMGNC